MIEYSTPDDEGQQIKLPFYARLTLVLLCIVLVLLLMRLGSSLFIPLFFSVLVAFMLMPLTKWLERRKLGRGTAALVSLMLFIIGLGGLLYLLGFQTAQFTKDLPLIREQLLGWIERTQHWIARKYDVNMDDQATYLRDHADVVTATATLALRSVVSEVLGFVLWLIFVFIFTFFILTHRALLRKFVTCLFKQQYQKRVTEVMSETRALANAYIGGLLLEMVIVAGANCILLWVFGIKYALLLGVLAAVLNIVPYIGVYTATAVAAIITLSNATPGAALTCTIILLVIHFFDANVLLPRIVGRRVKMNPLVTIVAVILGQMIWGIAGMFLFIPLIGMLKIVFERVDGLKPWAMLMDTD